MYKKITHTIVEEHFDHPIASQIKKSLAKKTITNDIFTETKFRTDVRDYFSTYINHVIAFIDSVGGTDQDILNNFDNFYKTAWIDDLGNMTKSIYFTEFGERLNESFRMIPTTLLTALQSIKDGKDIGPSGSKAQFITNELTQNLTNFNTNWPYQTINNLIGQLFLDWFALAKAKIAKNTTLDQQLTQKIMANWATFEKTFVDGIIAQHPERFTKATTLSTTSNSRDIM